MVQWHPHPPTIALELITLSSERSCTTFDTAIGRCAIAWNERGLITGVWLPESDGASPSCEQVDIEIAHLTNVRRAIDGIQRLLDGELDRVDDGELDRLDDVELEMQGLPDFHRRVYTFLRTIGPGSTTTYGTIAHALGEPNAARAVGQAMARNPFPIIVPCHRVLAAGGKAGGFSAPGGVDTKRRILTIEGAINAIDAVGAAPNHQPSLFSVVPPA